MISRRALLAAGAAIGAGVVTRAQAQSFPDRPIRMIVPFAAGGPVDVMARLVGQPLSGIIGQPIVVENWSPPPIPMAIRCSAATSAR